MNAMQQRAALAVTVCVLGLVFAHAASVKTNEANASAGATSSSTSTSSSSGTQLFWGDANIFSLQAWVEYVMVTYEEDPGHVLIEAACIAIIVYLLIRPSYDPQKRVKLTAREEDALIREWTPDPLTPELTAEYFDDPPVLDSICDAMVVADGRQCMNLSSTNFMGIASSPEVRRACRETIDKYGVGSCGPRGFYGTIDVHLDLEKVIAKFYGVPEVIVYSDGIACIPSVIPAFAKRGDLIICDEAVHFGFQQGVELSRSNVLYFKHNDMDDLERILNDVREKDIAKGIKQPKTRRFICVEGIYQQHGDLCPLKKVIELKKRFKYRVILDDTMALGVLGDNGKGSAEYWKVPISDIDALCANLDASIASAGGFCAGPHQICEHQRLSGLGYCFSASAPPYVSTAAIMAFKILEEEPQRCEIVRNRARRFRQAVQDIPGIRCVGDAISPILHLRLQRSFGSRAADNAFFKIVAEKLRTAHDIVATVPAFVPTERAPPEPSLRVLVTSRHSEVDIDRAAHAIEQCFAFAFDL